MKANLIVLVTASFIGLTLGYFITRPLLDKWNEGKSYESADALREAITERNEQDRKKDGSLSLRSVIAPHSSDSIIYHLRPNLDVKFLGKRLQTNSLGMRGPELSESSDFRIALLGDSFAFGWGVEYEESFAFLLAERLSSLTKKKVEVLNFAAPGYSTFQEVSWFETHDVVPDVILVYFVENDFGAPFFIRDFSGQKSLARAERLQSFRNSKKEKVKTEAEKIVGYLNPNNWLRKLSNAGKEKGFSTYVAFNPQKRWKKDRRMLPMIDQRSNLHTIDLRTPLLKLLADRDISSDKLTLEGDPHPSPIMHELLAEILATKLQGVVDSKAQQD